MFSFHFQEHRTHIDVLDSALSNAQTTVLRLEEVKREMTKNLEQLQVHSAFFDLILFNNTFFQAASEKRELMEKKLRAKLEEELNILRHGEENNTSTARENGENTEQLRQKLSLFEEKVCLLIWIVLRFLSWNSLISGDQTGVRENPVGTKIP